MLQMARLREKILIFDRRSSREVESQFVELNAHLCAEEIDRRWWSNPPGSTKGMSEADRRWVWTELYHEMASMPYWDAVGLVTPDGRLQGAMIYQTDAKSLLEDGEGAVYVDNLATAPWNRPWLTDAPMYAGVGSALLHRAIHHSHLLTYGGRVNLATLPTATKFYLAQRFQGTGRMIEGLSLLEISAQDARHTLVEKGLVPRDKNIESS